MDHEFDNDPFTLFMFLALGGELFQPWYTARGLRIHADEIIDKAMQPPTANPGS